MIFLKDILFIINVYEKISFHKRYSIGVTFNAFGFVAVFATAYIYSFFDPFKLAINDFEFSDLIWKEFKKNES